MSEKRILIGSILKPVNDTRMYEKLGVSLSKIPDSQIHICGYPAPVPTPLPANICFHTFRGFKRLSLGRAQAQLQFYKLLKRVKPHLIICCTHELLLVSYFYSLTNACQIIYDVQENYTLNLKAQHNYTFLLKHTFAFILGTIEKLLSPRITHFFLAEKSYRDELCFLRNNYTIIENKYKPLSDETAPTTPVAVHPDRFQLLYSGTISEVYGIFEAITFTEQLHRLNPHVKLTIIGYSPSNNTLLRVIEQIKNKPFITLIGGHTLVPHHEIIAQIKKSNLALLPYQYNKSTFRCIPTKLYEYAALGLPMLIQSNPLWHAIVKQYKAGISIDFKRPDYTNLLQNLSYQTFFTSGIPDQAFWATEETVLLQVVQKILKVDKI